MIHRIYYLEIIRVIYKRNNLSRQILWKKLGYESWIRWRKIKKRVILVLLLDSSLRDTQVFVIYDGNFITLS